ncbi:MAG TPA: NUDIX domain-containing protein [Solirubrobacterales bacterium]|jgi:predicted NUDIX family NTP pyrophosphohydrolase|nr:NUDIX domain-containing protein [Solirubrobacterales bacterium]
MAAKRSAGVLLFRHAGGQPEFLLVHPGGPYWSKRDQGAWSIPKGEIEPGEETRACALREMREELGPAPDLDPERMIELGQIRQKSGKVVEAWAAEGDFDPEALDSIAFAMEWPPRSGKESEFPEVDRAGWFCESQARAKILPAQAAFIDRLLEHLSESD